MSAFNLLSIGGSALLTNYAALQTTGHNIANAGTDGFSRQRVELSPQLAELTGDGFFGRGVRLQTVSRAQDEFLTRDEITKLAVAGSDAARLDLLQRMEVVFKTGELGIGYAANQFLNSIVDVANRPSDEAARQVMLARAGEVASRFQEASGALDTLQRDVRGAVSDAVVQASALADAIAKTNEAIVKLRFTDATPNDLLDERERLLRKLSDLIQIKTVDEADGSVSVYVAGGQPLVLRLTASELKAVPDPSDPNRMALSLATSAYQLPLDTESLGGGSLAGWLRFQNEDLKRAGMLIGQMGASLVEAVNARQALGLNLVSQAGTDLFGIQHAYAVPQTPGATGQLRVRAIEDPTQLQLSEYKVEVSAAGATTDLRITRLSDGAVTTLTGLSSPTTAQIDGFTLEFSGLAAGEEYLLQPLTRVAGSISRVMSDPKGIAAASPITAVISGSNTGTGSVRELKVISAPAYATVATNPVTLSYSAATQSFLINDGVSTSTQAWTPGAAIAFQGFELTLDGVPQDGDVFTVSSTAFPSQNGGNALAMLGLRDTEFVAGKTITEAYAAAMADVGVRVQGAKTSADISKATSDQAVQRRASYAGVNLDEEGARLIQFQQAYQAAAKVLQTAQTIFDTLLQATS